jgi:cell division protein FtsB
MVSGRDAFGCSWLQLCPEHKALLVHCEELREQLARTDGENGNLRRRVAELRENVKQLQEVVVVDC